MLIVCAALSAGMIACEPYRIEHRKRPEFYKKAVEGELPDAEVLEDGTVVLYEPTGISKRATDAAGGGSTFQTREELEDGTVILRSRIPDHLLANMFLCLQRQEYELMYDQLLADRTRDQFEALPNGYEEFEAYFAKHRIAVAQLIRRLLLGQNNEEVEIERKPGGFVRMRLRAQYQKGFTFTSVTMEGEGSNMTFIEVK